MPMQTQPYHAKIVLFLTVADYMYGSLYKCVRLYVCIPAINHMANRFRFLLNRWQITFSVQAAECALLHQW